MTDLEIAHQYQMLDIKDVAKKLELSEEQLEFYGKYKAKIDPNTVLSNKNGKLILVTAINPTPYGEGKTTVSIGLGDALRKLGKNSLMVLREPSLGPVFGMKGGATGGGYSQIVPMEDINLHFTGDFHAITAANNLLCAAIDNQFYFGNPLQLDPNTISFSRCLDMNDRALRKIQIGLSSTREQERTESFQITAASEIMTIFCLSKDIEDLRNRLDSIFIGYTYQKEPIYAKDLSITGAMLSLLKDAIKPNLVQTLEGNPVLVHGGPFANIAHGCNSLIATKLGLRLSDYVVTEAGFGADLGAEKFLDLKCRIGKLKPSAIVLVATIKALKYNGGLSKEEILVENLDALQRGLSNLLVHIENLKKYEVPFVVCLNQYDTDTKNEISVVEHFCEEEQVPFEISTAYKDGGSGAIKLAQKVISLTNEANHFHYLYDDQMTVFEKIDALAKEIYHAKEVVYSDLALSKLQDIELIHQNYLPICVAKTQYSISDDPKLLGYPKDYTLHVKDVNLYSGAGFITILLGNIMTMPGLPEKPNYEKIDVINHNIVGLF